MILPGELNTLRKVENPNYPDSADKYHPHPPFNPADGPPLSRPGGWAYPGTMVVGDGDMTKDENAVHFGGWCIVSSPLILAFNLSDSDRHDLVWDIITNKEAIQVNQAWAGHPGSQVLHSIGNNSQVEVWTKPLGNGRTAALIINTADKASSLGGMAAAVEAEAEAAAAAAALPVPELLRASTLAPAPSPPRPELRLNPCDATAKTQQWLLSPGVTPGVRRMNHATPAAVSEIEDPGGVTHSPQRGQMHIVSRPLEADSRLSYADT